MAQGRSILFHMPTGARKPTIESKALSIAIKRAMVTRQMRVPALAEMSGVPYGTLRRILELNSVADYEQLRKICKALHTPLSVLVEDAERLATDPGVINDWKAETEPEEVAQSPVDDLVARLHHCSSLEDYQ